MKVRFKSLKKADFTQYKYEKDQEKVVSGQ